jgi:hypothetical protein
MNIKNLICFAFLLCSCTFFSCSAQPEFQGVLTFDVTGISENGEVTYPVKFYVSFPIIRKEFEYSGETMFEQFHLDTNMKYFGVKGVKDGFQMGEVSMNDLLKGWKTDPWASSIDFETSSTEYGFSFHSPDNSIYVIGELLNDYSDSKFLEFFDAIRFASTKGLKAKGIPKYLKYKLNSEAELKLVDIKETELNKSVFYLPPPMEIGDPAEAFRN